MATREYETADLMVTHYRQRSKGLLDDLKTAATEDDEEALDSLSKTYKGTCGLLSFWEGVLGRSKTGS